MTKPDDQSGSGGGNPPAPPTKTAEEQLAEVQKAQKELQAQLQSSQEELKRVNNLNGVLMSRMKEPSNSGMDVNKTTPIKLKRDFSQMDPASDPAGFAQNIVLETAEQVAETLNRHTEQQNNTANLRRAFYEKHKDLVGFEIEVGHFSSVVQAEMPSVPFDQAAEEIARRTRDYVKQKGLHSDPANPDDKTPPHVLPEGGTKDGKVPIKTPKGDEPFNPDKVYQDDMSDYSKMRNNERDRSGTRGKA